MLLTHELPRLLLDDGAADGRPAFAHDATRREHLDTPPRCWALGMSVRFGCGKGANAWVVGSIMPTRTPRPRPKAKRPKPERPGKRVCSCGVVVWAGVLARCGGGGGGGAARSDGRRPVLVRAC